MDKLDVWRISLVFMVKKSIIDDYISNFPEETQRVLNQIQEIIREAAPEAEETISYQIPTFKLNGKYFIYFAGWKSHVSLYPIPEGDNEFQKEITPYVAGKGTLKFPLEKPIPYELIKKVVRLSVQEHTATH